MKQFLQSGQAICLLLFLLVSALTGQTQVVVQGDSEQVSNSQAARRGIYRLKAALAKPAGSVEETDSLLTMARQFGSPSAQVVALCQLASLRLQRQQNQQASALVQEANRLTPQLRDVKDVGWALGQIARIQANTMRAAPSSATMFSPLLESLGRSMATSALSRGRSRDDVPFTFDGPTPVPPDRRTTERRAPPEPPVEYN
ncbi:MAG: hypothetical protein EOO39_27110, partial [Cytophagaceae bacterium]